MIWTAVLRPVDNEIVLTEAWTLTELHKKASFVQVRMRYNADMRLLVLRLPDGTKREQVFAAFDHLTAHERSRLYNMRQLVEKRRA